MKKNNWLWLTLSRRLKNLSKPENIEIKMACLAIAGALILSTAWRRQSWLWAGVGFVLALAATILIIKAQRRNKSYYDYEEI
jgi:sensor c-di-GMP phosphodiesterase-like protein